MVNVINIFADAQLQIIKGDQIVMSNTVKSLVELFVNVMKRREEHINIDWNYKPALFEISDDKKLMSLSIFKQYMQMRYSGNKGIYVKRSGILKNAQSVIDKLDSKQFYNELNRIPACKVNNSLKKKYPIFIREFIQNGKNVIGKYLERIFQPNKVSQTILSSLGTDIDITALILNLINPVPDPKIYLEKKKRGLIRNYSITVVIDA